MAQSSPDHQHGDLHNKMLGMASDTILRISTLPGFMKAMLREDGWKRLVRPIDHRVFENATIEAWVLGEPWPGLHFPNWAMLYALLQKNIEDGPECLLRLQQAGAPSQSEAELAFRMSAAENGPQIQTSSSEAGKKGGRGHQRGISVIPLSKSKGSARLTARLKHDHQEVFAALKRGEYRSVRAAAKAAGIVRDKTPLQQLEHWWKKATPDERATFVKKVTIAL